MTDLKCPHCGVELDSHEEGDCLDAWMAQDLFGYVIRRGADFGRPPYAHALLYTGVVPGEAPEKEIPGDGATYYRFRDAQPYSTTPAGMWAVVEEMQRRGFDFSLCTRGGRAGARFFSRELADPQRCLTLLEIEPFLAAARAALKALGEGKR